MPRPGVSTSAVLALLLIAAAAQGEPAAQVSADGASLALVSRWSLDNWNGHCDATMVQVVRVGRDGASSQQLAEGRSAYALVRRGDPNVVGCGRPTRRTAWRRRHDELDMTPRDVVPGGALRSSRTLEVGDVSLRIRAAGAQVEVVATTATGRTRRRIARPADDLTPRVVQATVVHGYAYVHLRWSTVPGKVAFAADRWYAIALR